MCLNVVICAKYTLTFFLKKVPSCAYAYVLSLLMDFPESLLTLLVLGNQPTSVQDEPLEII
jgi:hypothetical protein